ncbi:DUF1707 domain-containing protein [Saccharopolyspora sp. HNM0983]|uniref:DUF1707 domain-containing protein n=1 Tax=Saccharopolyspora montiporae TaxID=2781240 RepID=A0A929FZU4_9PSEU|nr:DUF1707 domain-containing protein [Saccharopolyspora sp. HNM0983]MBE9372923.1 DUF1707 domain-containing protein [Saccharopolyspora sp. HNM0983]
MATTDSDQHALAARGRSGEIRIGDGDRAAADRLLGEHVTAGRLTSTEYAERAGQAGAARVRGDITALFGDLPAPHPRFDDGPAAEPAAPAPDLAPRPVQPLQRNRQLRHLTTAVIAPCAVFGAAAGLVLAADAPALLLLALLVVGTVYGVLVVVDLQRAVRGQR